MKVLIIKTSSLGDVVHCMPALAQAKSHHPQYQFDWVVEEGFAPLVAAHPLVRNVIPCAIRRWRKQLLSGQTYQEASRFIQALRAEAYDLVIDAQGLIKSALIGRMARGPLYGHGASAVRDKSAAIFYQHKIAGPSYTEMHAITFTQRLFSKVLGYSHDETHLDYGLAAHQGPGNGNIVLLHGTTAIAKCYPEENWVALARQLMTSGYGVKLFWGNQEELERAKRIGDASGAVVSDKLSIKGVLDELYQSSGAVSVDTGIGHMCGGIGLPCVSLYGPTDPKRIGVRGAHQQHLSLSAKPDEICDALTTQLSLA